MANEDYYSENPTSLQNINKYDVITVENLSTKSALFSHQTRSTFAQCLATLINSMSLLSLGFLCAFPTVVIGDTQNAKTGLSLTEEQASWYASFLPIFQPVGCILGGFLQNYIGRKHGLLLMNSSTTIAWLVLYYAASVEMLYASSVLMGISIGLGETPSGIYVCEISTPKLRGTLVMLDNSNVVTGIMLTFLLTSFVSWKTACLINIGYCIFTVLVLTFIPDSPVWLIRKGKAEKAKKALRWLRGWVSESDVQQEFEELSQHIQKSHSDHSNQHSPQLNLVWKLQWKIKNNFLTDKGILRPLIFLMSYMIFACAACLLGARNYILVILNSLNLPVDSKQLAFVNGLMSQLGAYVSVAAVRKSGKRTLSLTSMISSSALGALLGLYMLFQDELNQPWVFIVSYIVLGFTSSIAMTVPWILMGEIYPVKNRTVAAGITGAMYYLLYAVYIKTYYHLQLLLSTSGTFVLYGVLGFVGFFFLWVFMPETEGKSMAEIEELFLDDARSSCPHFRKKK